MGYFRPALAALAPLALLVATGCGDDSVDSPVQTLTAETLPSSTEAAPVLPGECTPPPFTVVAERDGAEPAGSAEFEVVSTAGLPVPLIPNADQSVPADQVMARGAETELLGYVLFFGDEVFTTADVSLFGGYEPDVAGKGRGAISVFPDTTTPLVAGQTLTPGPAGIPNLFTTLNTVNVDVKVAPGELTMYLNSIEGSVTILGLTATSICLDVDLSWQYTDGGSDPDGTLTVKGIFTADLAPRSMPFT